MTHGQSHNVGTDNTRKQSKRTATSIVIDTQRVRRIGQALDEVSTRGATHVADRELRPLLAGRPPGDDLGYIVAGIDAAGDRAEKIIDRAIKSLARFSREAADAQESLDNKTAQTYSSEQIQ